MRNISYCKFDLSMEMQLMLLQLPLSRMHLEARKFLRVLLEILDAEEIFKIQKWFITQTLVISNHYILMLCYERKE